MKKIATIYTKQEHNIDIKKIDKDCLSVINQLHDCGYHAYVVGGAVRDLLIGHTPKDFDIVTDATPSQIKKMFRNSRIIGKRFRLVHVFFGQKIFEVSTFRSIENGTSIGNVFGTIDEDVKRRDFSLNALYYDPLKEQIIDYVNGLKDIQHKRIRAVIPLDKIFEEDPVRMIRAIKYSSSTGFKMQNSLKKKILKSANLLSTVSPSRLTEEMQKIINSGYAYKIVYLALKLDVYLYLQPLASGLMYENSDYEKNYLQSLKKLDQKIHDCPKIGLGQKLVFLIQDYVNSLTDWKKEPKDIENISRIYRQTWKECRNFILPMNPQRTELEFAVREALRRNGVTVPSKRKTKSSS